MPISLVHSEAVGIVAGGTASQNSGSTGASFSFAQRQLRFFKIVIENNSNSAIDLTGELGSDGVIGGDSDNNLGVVQQVVQVLQNYGTVEHLRVGNADATDGCIFAALDVGGSAEEDGATWVPRLAAGSATTLPAAIQADIRVLRNGGYSAGVLTALGAAGTTAGKDANVDVRGSDVTETGFVLVA
jgi:hypothetical protein